MDKAELGTKRVCPSCGARFYDLSKRPIVCPKCAFAFEPETMFKQRRARHVDQEDKNRVEAEENENEEEIEENEDALAEAGDEEQDTVTSDEDEETTEDAENAPGMSVVDGEDVEIEDLDGDDVEEDEGDVSLLEEVEEDEDDVSGIIDADIEKDER